MRIAQPIAAACLILLVLAVLWQRDRVPALDRYDQHFYLGIAYDLRHHHRFTDGYAFAGGDAATLRPPGMRFTPLYPSLLVAASWLDPGLARATDCLVAHGGDAATCPRGGGQMRTAQLLMLAATYWLIWWCGGAIAGRSRIGWIALALALPTAPLLLLSVDYLMTEITSLLLVIGAQAAALRALLSSSRRGAWSLLAGLALGLAVLARPGFEALAIAGLAVAAIAARGGGPALRAAAWFWLGVFATVGPWILRNALVLHRVALTFGYASHTFVQRLSFDSMGWRDYALSFACWMPDGNGIGALVAGRHACDRFGWDDHPDSFYAIGIGPMLRQTLRAAGGWEHHMGYLVRTYLLAHPLRQIGWHLLVSLPLALRGLCVDHWWGFVLAIPCAALTLRALADRGPVATRFLLLALPAWLMLAVNALIAVDQPRYNLQLVAPFAIAAALAIDASSRQRRPPA